MRVFSFVLLALFGIGAAAVAWFFFLHDYQKERVFTFLNPERDPLGAAYHAIQSQIAVGSGGLFGKGFGQGSQSQLDFLPEQQTDFVFSVLGEEWGFVGVAVVLLLYLGILLRGLMIAHSSKDLFGSYLALGIVALFFWAGVINIGMVIGVLPVVGVPLADALVRRLGAAHLHGRARSADERLHAPLHLLTARIRTCRARSQPTSEPSSTSTRPSSPRTPAPPT